MFKKLNYRNLWIVIFVAIFALGMAGGILVNPIIVGKTIYRSSELIDFKDNAMTFATDNEDDIGASGANRPKSMYLGTSLIAASTITTGGVGAVAQNPAATVVEYGADPAIHHTIITLAEDSLTIDGATGVGFGGQKFYDFPEGRILILGTTVDLTFDLTACDLDDADGGDFALGTVVVSDADLGDATDVDLCPSTSVDPLSDGFTGALAASAHFDGTGTAKDLCLNGLIDDADIGAAGEDILVSGTITVTWINLGDF